MSQNVDMNKNIYWIAITLVALMVAYLLPTQALAHDDDIPSPDGLVAPSSPELPIPSPQQTLYRISRSETQAQYSVQEKYVGLVDGKRVVGRTSEVAGELLIDWDNPAQSQLGMVTVNVEQLTSDSKQRDRQIRKSYLESSLYPEATFIPEPEQTFPTEVTIGEPFSLVLHGYLTVHGVTILSDWQVELTVEPARIIGRATTEILMSDFGVGPINIIGLLSTADEMTLTLDFVALADGEAPPTVEIPTVVAQPTVAQSIMPQSDLLFSDIRPILETKCVACHMEGELGHTVYPMETVGDVVEYADDLALVIETGFMPPWLPSHLTPAFKNDRSLDEADQAALLEWIAAGAPNDVALDEPLENRAPVGNSLREDVVLTMPEPYIPTGDLADDYRCFLLDPQLPEGGFVTGSNVIPGDRRVVHHVILFQAAADSRAEAEEKAAEDDRPGWECFGGPELSSSEPGGIGNSVGIWVPGSDAMLMDEETGVYVPPGGLVVMQVHYNYSADFYPDQTSAVLQVESADSDIISLRGLPLLAPVEIPCPANSDNAACDRDVSIAQRDEGDRNLAEPLLWMCGKEVSDYAEESAESATSSCDRRIPIDGDLVQINGHMHTKGTSQRVTLNPDGPNPIILQDLPLWDFNWQGGYQFETPITVKKGDILRLTCTWDNTKEQDPDNARYITWGEGTNDEMCLNMATIKPAAGFEERAGRALFVDSFTIYPNWMPAWARIFMMMLRSLSTGVKIVAGAVITLMFVAVLYGIRRLSFAKKPVYQI